MSFYFMPTQEQDKEMWEKLNPGVPYVSLGDSLKALFKRKANNVSSSVNYAKEVVSPLQKIDLKQGFESLADAINNGFSAYSSSALAFEKEALRNQQDYNAEQARIAFERSQSSAREQMQFQKEMQKDVQAYNTLMSNTQYQRAVADLKMAGINPIMAIKGLNGSSPTVSAVSGASASASPASSSRADFTSALSEDKKVIDAISGLLSSSASILKLLKKR